MIVTLPKVVDIMKQDGRLSGSLWSWLRSLAMGQAEMVDGEHCTPSSHPLPILRYVPAQYPALVTSNEPGPVLVHCRDLDVGARLAEAISRYGRSVYICNELDETVDLALSTPENFFCVLFAETLPGGEADIAQILAECGWTSDLRWSCIDAVLPITGSSDGPTEQAEQIASFERMFVDLCHSFTAVRCAPHTPEPRTA